MLAEVVYDLTWPMIVFAIAVSGVFVTKLLRNTGGFESNLYKKRHNLQNSYVKDLEEDNEGLKGDVKTLKSQASRRERGPALEDGEWDKLIPDFIGDVSQFLPKKLQPFFKDTNLQQAIIKKVLDDPERFKPYIDKFISKTIGKTAESETTPAQEGL